jgi:hypothetical protein
MVFQGQQNSFPVIEASGNCFLNGTLVVRIDYLEVGNAKPKRSKHLQMIRRLGVVRIFLAAALQTLDADAKRNADC